MALKKNFNPTASNSKKEKKSFDASISSTDSESKLDVETNEYVQDEEYDSDSEEANTSETEESCSQEEDLEEDCNITETDESDDEAGESSVKGNEEMEIQNDSGSELDYVVDYGPKKKCIKMVTDTDTNDNSTDDEELALRDEDVIDEDGTEVLERVSAGKLKYGRTYEEDHNIKKEYINREEEMQQKYKELYYKGDWLQRLDITCKAAPVAPEMQHAIEADKKIQSKKLAPLKNPFKDVSVLKDDFERETLFQRHAQAAVLVGVPKLQHLDLYTRRNEEFYAEMVKSDKQMHKVRKDLRKKLLDRQASEHARKLRKMRKFGKKVQAEVILTKAQKKRELMTKLKEYRQGQRNDLDFLDGAGRSAADNYDETSPYVRQRRGAPAGRGRGGRRGGRAPAQSPRMRAMLVSDGRSRGGRGRGRGGRGGRAGPNKRKQMRGGGSNSAYMKAKRGFTR